MARAPKIAWPTRTQVEPPSMAASKSPLIPIDSSPSPTVPASSAASRSRRMMLKHSRTRASSLVLAARVMSPRTRSEE